MRLGSLEITLHRTVRVADSRTPANLPPSLGWITTYAVKDFRKRCPERWEDEGVFIGLHDTEALWLSFHAREQPVALLVGAGAINALTGKKLGTKLDTGNYLVTPPQPWLDGWKNADGTVHQFVATAYRQGKGNTVAEQLIGAESQTGGIGIALFDAQKPLPAVHYPSQKWGYGADSGEITSTHLGSGTIGSYTSGNDISFAASHHSSITASVQSTKVTTRAARPSSASLHKIGARSDVAFSEMGLGKGGKIIQKVYEDPYGLDVWKELPTATCAIYVVHAALLAEITGHPIAKPIAQSDFSGPWFGLEDTALPDVPGTNTFTGLKSVFAEETTSEYPAKK
jgi:hypothetical protein